MGKGVKEKEKEERGRLFYYESRERRQRIMKEI
jgi:hypothetical protein